MTNKFIIIVLLCASSCSAMEDDASKVATHQEIHESITKVVRTGYSDMQQSLSDFQATYKLLYERQNAWVYAVKDNKLCYAIQANDQPPVDNDVKLWTDLSDRVDTLQEHIEEVDIDILRRKCTLLSALISRGRSIELLRSVEFCNDLAVGVQSQEIQKTFGPLNSAYLQNRALADSNFCSKTKAEFYEGVVVQNRDAIKKHLLKMTRE